MNQPIRMLQSKINCHFNADFENTTNFFDIFLIYTI